MYKTDSLTVSSGYVNVLCVVLPLLSCVTTCPKGSGLYAIDLAANYRVHTGLVSRNSELTLNSFAFIIG